MNPAKLNSGITQIVSVKKYPVTRQQPLPRNTKGRVFRLGVLHSKEMTEALLLRNRRGFINSQVNTVAHAPSFYHWLFHRCGVPFEETRELVKSGGLAVDGIALDHAGLERQLDWATMQKMDIRIRVEVSPFDQISGSSADDHNSGTGSSSSSGGSSSVMWVPALKRALHRQYFFVYIHPGVSITSDQTDPRSFVHRLVPLVGSTAVLGMNILRPIGFMNGMKGIALATNDVSMVRYWNNEFLGNYGVYDVRFARGIPSKVVHRLSEDVNIELEKGIKKQLSVDVKVPCSCTLDALPIQQMSDVITRLYSRPFHDERLVISTPLFPYRVARKIRHVGGVITLVRSGPFALPPLLPATKQRLLSPQELALMFTFERKLKTNRVVLSLREFDVSNGDGSSDEGDPEIVMPPL